MLYFHIPHNALVLWRVVIVIDIICIWITIHFICITKPKYFNSPLFIVYATTFSLTSIVTIFLVSTSNVIVSYFEQVLQCPCCQHVHFMYRTYITVLSSSYWEHSHWLGTKLLYFKMADQFGGSNIVHFQGNFTFHYCINSLLLLLGGLFITRDNG